MHASILRPVLLFLIFAFGACAASAPTAEDEIVVTGTITVRGNEPFTALVLQTPDRNAYVLTFAAPEIRAEVQDAAPAVFRVRGSVYRDSWNNRPFAHLRVGQWERLAAQSGP